MSSDEANTNANSDNMEVFASNAGYADGTSDNPGEQGMMVCNKRCEAHAR